MTQPPKRMGLSPAEITDGPFKGWMSWGETDPFDAHVGPFYHRADPERGVVCAFEPVERHLNGLGLVHGGALMCLSDYALFAIAWQALGQDGGVTVHLSGDFLAAGRLGDRIEASGAVTRAGGTLLFVRGDLSVQGRTLLNWSGIIQRLQPKRR